MVVEQIKCPWHSGDNTPSYTIYADGSGYCFGCGKYTPAEGGVCYTVQPVKPKEDLEASIKYIDELPKELIRGLWLPRDETGYYFVWPEGTYYKKRLFDESKGKYRCPSGHEKPLLVYPGDSTLLITEGEANALSAYEATPHTIICPGGAGDFKKAARSILTVIDMFDRVVVVVDNDEAGALAAIEMKGILMLSQKCITIRLVDRDFNEVYDNEGKEALKERIVDLLRGVPSGSDSMSPSRGVAPEAERSAPAAQICTGIHDRLRDE